MEKTLYPFEIFYHDLHIASITCKKDDDAFDAKIAKQAELRGEAWKRDYMDGLHYCSPEDC